MKIKAGGKVIIGLIIASVVGYGANKAIDSGYFKDSVVVASSVPMSMDLPSTSATPSGAISKVDVKRSDSNFTIPYATIPWNGTAGLHLAVGGSTTQSGSLMAQNGVNVSVKRIDMYDQMIAEMVAFAKARKDGNANPTEGLAMHTIMGDGTPNHMRALNEALGKYGQSAEIIAIVGKSYGEDKCMLPASAKSNPQKARGMTVGGVPRDGDLHICFKWAADNKVPVNANAKLYDPDALNIMEVDDFNKSDQNYIAGFCEDRPVVKAGKKTSDTAKVCISGVATWTPGDVTVAKKKGGLVSVASTREYENQMASVIIGNKQWMAENETLVVNFIAAALAGSEQILTSDSALEKASAIQAKTYNQEDAAYWKKYYKGVVEPDAQGIMVNLGGSKAMGLADNAVYFGLKGNDNVFKKVYTVFGDIDKHYYPNEMPSYLPYEQVVNTKYLETLLAKATNVAPAQTVNYSPTAQVKDTVSKAAWSIEFDNGKATFTPKSMQVLDDLLNQLSVGNMTLQITGHTDNVGDPTSNLTLSNQRANAVKNFLMANAPSTMTAERIRARGYGDTQPVAENSTAAGKAKNRRVEISQVITQ